ncbi:uncharacterized protein [Diadema antillarum]|uniref:uncharacterized protein n=1 Tax=Diadema antillarum TaxID=105358 RepID=UPI003A857156
METDIHHRYIITPLPKAPDDLVLEDDEVVIAVGLKFSSPNDKQPEKPIKLTMPHCAVITKPERVSTVLYHRNDDSEQFSRVPVTYGSVRLGKESLVLTVNHFCQWWITAKITEFFFSEKRVICIPYIPKHVTAGERHTVTFIIHDDIQGVHKNIHEKMVTASFVIGRVGGGEQFPVKLNDGSVVVTMWVEEKVISTKVSIV